MQLRVEDFDYDLPTEQIANEPVAPRDAARMMVIDRNTGEVTHHRVRDLTEMLTDNDVLVINQTQVFPARLMGTKKTGGKAEILLLSDMEDGKWEALSKPGLEIGIELTFSEKLSATVVRSNNDEGVLEIHFNQVGDRLKRMIDDVGLVPLPPYIHSTATQKQLRQDYQTVFAHDWGSAAAPTAGLHFTNGSLKRLADEGVGIVPLTLHVGLGTFQPVTNDHLDKGKLHTERFYISRQAGEQIMRAKKHGKRIIAVGTTTARALETACLAVDGQMSLKTEWQETDLFIHPPTKFKIVDSMVTNFHLPKSSLLMLVSAFVSEPNTKRPFSSFAESLMGEAYAVAVSEKYRFFSFGDCMWIR
jgi:S-adenosylmethionine:tRNA ribosyltransferase-isomerase